MADDITSFGTKIQRLRYEIQLSQKEVSKLVGVAQSTYALYESDKREPDFKTLVRISNLFNVTTDYLLGIDQYRNAEEFEFFQGIAPPELISISLYRNLENVIRKLRGFTENPQTILNIINNNGQCLTILLAETLRKDVSAFDDLADDLCCIRDKREFIEPLKKFIIAINKTELINDLMDFLRNADFL